MPLHWDIRHSEQMVTLRTEGVLTFADVTRYLEAISAAGAIGYRKLTDARDGCSEMTESELTSYLGAVAGYSGVEPPGPQAVIVTPDSARAHEPMLKMLFVNKDRDLQMFTDPEEALEWLRQQPLSR